MLSSLLEAPKAVMIGVKAAFPWSEGREGPTIEVVVARASRGDKRRVLSKAEQGVSGDITTDDCGLE